MFFAIITTFIYWKPANCWGCLQTYCCDCDLHVHAKRYLMIQKRHVTRVSLVELFYLVTMLHDDCSVCQQHLVQVNTTCKQQQQRSKCLSLSLGVSQSASKLTSFLSPTIQSETNAQTQATLQPTTNDFVLVLFIGNRIGKHSVQ